MVTQFPEPTKEPKQRSINLDDIYLTKFIAPWVRSQNVSADAWRWWVFNEPIAMICRETLIANIIALDWEITPRKSEQREELQAVIRHYTHLLERGGDYYGFDWTGFVEWIMADLQDLPFGSGVELGRKNDSPSGRVLWVKPLDGGTLYPTLNKDYPVIQYYNTYDIVTFPAHTIARAYMSPRPELLKEGWGLAPPEKIYFALLMLYRGDKYYADLLLDSPPAGVFDLGDTEWESALSWVESLRNYFIGGSSSYKIPVLAEHSTPATFIPFGKVPNDIMYDRITLKYAAIVAAAYGMSLSDIGLQTTSASGETLAGSIRQERRTKRTGFARAKKKIKYLIESFLPDVLQFNFIDLDDELNVALGRARLATITALGMAQDKGVISATEHRLILLGDGLFGSTNLPEEPPPDAKPLLNKPLERPGALGSPQPASSGGEGEVKMRSIHVGEIKNLESHLKRFVGDVTKSIGQVVSESAKEFSEDELYIVRSMVDDSLFGEEDILGLLEIIKSLWSNKRWMKLNFDDEFADELAELAEKSTSNFLENRALLLYENGEIEDAGVWKSEFESAKEKLHRVDWKTLAEQLKDLLNENSKVFLGKSATFILKDLLLSENLVDTEDDGSDNIVDKVYKSLYDNFESFISTSVNLDVDKLITEIRNGVV